MEATNDILQLIQDVPIKGAVHNYDPINFNEMGSDKYGGFGDNPNRGRGLGNRGGAGGDGGNRFDRRGNDNDRGNFGNRRFDRDGGGGGRNNSRFVVLLSHKRRGNK